MSCIRTPAFTALALCASLIQPAFAQESATLAKIKSSGTISLGHRESSIPFSYYDDKQQVVGYSQEFMLKVVDAVKAELKLPSLAVKLTPVTSQNRIPLIQNGTVDIECGSTTNNTARQKDVSFAVTTYVTEVRTAVKKASNITSIAQLAGKSVATTTGTTSVALLRKHERGNNINFNEVYGKDHADSFLLLESGRADAFVMDDNILAGLIASSKSPADYAIVGETLNVEPIAIMIRKDDPAFKKAVDDYIKAQMKSGDLDKLYAKWFQAPIPPKNTSVNLAMGGILKELVKNPSDKPAEDYNKK